MKVLSALFCLGLAGPVTAAEIADKPGDPEDVLGRRPPPAWILTNGVPVVTNAPGKLLSGSPGPGLYKTEPYTCLVLVPGKHPDDRMAQRRQLQLPETAARMPVVRPELRFVPWPPNQTATNNPAGTNRPAARKPESGKAK